MLEPRQFGESGIKVSALGYGAGHIGSPDMADKKVETMLNAVVDAGINLIDTARGYGASEERIGRFLGHRRQDIVLSTKIGYGIENMPDWTYETIIAGVEEALKLLKTDYIDIVHLHSCPKSTLEQGEVITALLKTVEDGKVRVAAYSGENEDLEFALDTGAFGSLQASLNIADQRTIDRYLFKAKDQGLGFIAKRPVANAPWRFDKRPAGHYCEEYWHRWKAMGLDFEHTGLNWQEIALRFSAFTWGVDSCIVGTTNLKHLKQNIAAVEAGQLPEDVSNAIREAFWANDRGWIGMI